MDSTTVKLKVELLKVGISVNDIWDLVNTRESYPEAVPILIKLLRTEPMADRMKEGFVRALAVKEAKGKGLARILIDEFNNTPKEKTSFRWAIGGTIDFLSTKDDLQSILKIVRDKENGKARQMLVMGLGKAKSVEVEHTLIELLDDDDVVLHAISALKRHKSLKAIGKIRKLLYHPHATVRKYAKKYLEKYDK